MKVIYIAGAYTASSYLGVERNIAAAREVAATFANNEIAFICPHLNSAHFEVVAPYVPPQWWNEMTMELLRRCDGIFLMAGYESSSGSLKELQEAMILGLDRFHHWDDLKTIKDWAANE